ncbi:hypothetical protein B0H16DRAFT_640816 [Mycena metata]|uniref:Uncharacterized protein n=1 Tax=Mycena metata TaxID=1033252 RepID=A0AAD7JAJ3_9AGAR|nr:hypothetical protein B0H16DRAFT_640816 [Mycena metata]
MFSTKAILIAFALVVVSSAAPAKPAPLVSPTITVCTEVNPTGGCVTLPVVSDSCINLNGGFTFLNKDISGATLPSGIICTFFENFGCLSTGRDTAVLHGGTYIIADIKFNDLTSSISCSSV